MTTNRSRVRWVVLGACVALGVRELWEALLPPAKPVRAGRAGGTGAHPAPRGLVGLR